MKKLIFLLLLIPCFVNAQKLIQPKGVMWFWEYTDPSCKVCPVLIFLPGSGERSDTPNFSKIQRNGTPKLLKSAGLNYLEGFTLLVPQQITSKSGYVGDPKNPDIIKFLTYIHENYLTEQVFVTGLSMGADGSWDASYRGGLAMVKAIVPVSGKGDYNGAKITQQRGIKAWGIHGSADTGVPASDGKRPINGMISIGGTPKWTIINGGGHNSETWDVAFSLTDRAELGGTTIYKWLLSLVTKPPEEIPGIYLDGQFCGVDSCRVDGHLIMIKK